MPYSVNIFIVWHILWIEKIIFLVDVHIMRSPQTNKTREQKKETTLSETMPNKANEKWTERMKEKIN